MTPGQPPGKPPGKPDKPSKQGNKGGGTLAWSSDPTPRRDEPAAPPPPAGDQTAKIQLERAGRGGKSVTVVRGLTLPAADLDALGKKLKAACGSGGTVKDGAIEIQGDHRDTVERLLRERGFKTKRVG